MSFSGIALYVLRAAAFALAVCGVYALYLKLRGRAIGLGPMLSAFYLAALVEITVLRGGVSWNDFFHAARGGVAWIPLRTTAGAFRSGAWPFLYHVIGNLAWFAPLGVILRKRLVWVALAAGFAVSLSIECLQWALMTGEADIDDVLLNAAGALIGHLFAGICAAPASVN